ncbi:MAG: 50S ribosomal protein L24 [Clostridium sp.]|jgi:large subunit ribosomal protein L24|nr:50S ribosomal protein L24 [Clostridium sp.]
MSTAKIRKGDLVRIITGKDNSKEGRILSIDRKKGRVIVEGANMISKHCKPSQANPQGGIIQREAPLDISNVMYVHKGKPTRIGIRILEDGKKVRFAKSTGEVIE